MPTISMQMLQVMAATTHEEAVDRLWNMAQHIMIKDAYHVPLLVVITTEYVLVGNAAKFLEQEKGKEALASGMQQLTKDPAVQAVGLITESWFSNNVITDVPPSLQPDRKEALMFFLSCRNGQRFQKAVVINRTEGGIVLKDMDMGNGAVGRFVVDFDMEGEGYVQ